MRVVIRSRAASVPLAIRAAASLIAWAVVFRLLFALGMVPLPVLLALTLGLLVVIERWCWLLFGRQIIESDGQRVRARRVLFGLGFGRWLPIHPDARWIVEHVRSADASLVVIETPGERVRRLNVDLPPHEARPAVEILARRGLANTFD